MACEPPPFIFMPYEPFLLGVGVVFSLLIEGLPANPTVQPMFFVVLEVSGEGRFKTVLQGEYIEGRCHAARSGRCDDSGGPLWETTMQSDPCGKPQCRVTL